MYTEKAVRWLLCINAKCLIFFRHGELFFTNVEMNNCAWSNNSEWITFNIQKPKQVLPWSSYLLSFDFFFQDNVDFFCHSVRCQVALRNPASATWDYLVSKVKLHRHAGFLIHILEVVQHYFAQTFHMLKFPFKIFTDGCQFGFYISILKVTTDLSPYLSIISSVFVVTGFSEHGSSSIVFRPALKAEYHLKTRPWQNAWSP